MRAAIAFALTIVAAGLLSVTEPAQAAAAKAKAPQRWCLTSESGNSDCTFDTLKQCQASRSGISITSTCFRARRQHPGTPTR